MIESERPPRETEETNLSEKEAIPRPRWDKEQFDTRRPYERKDYDRPFRKLPGHFSAFGGLNDGEPRHCATADTFTRRTPIEEVFHKRNFKRVCPAEVSRPVDEYVQDVIAADNVSSSEYFNREPSPPAQEDDTDDSEGDLPPDVLDWEEENNVVSCEDLGRISPYQVRSSSVGSYQPPTITHREDKVRVVEAQDQFLERMRARYLGKFERFREQMEDAERERRKPPAPFDPEQYEAQYPEIDTRNEERVRFRESLQKRLEELSQLQLRPVRSYPTSVKQFAAYKAQLMENRRKLRDEACLVEDYFRKANTPVELPEAKLEVKRYRLAEFGRHPDDSPDEEDYQREPTESGAPLVYHTCMTRNEWGHWMARSVAIEKLALPKVIVPRVPVLVQKCTGSPIRAHVQGRLDVEQAGKPRANENLPREIIHSIRETTMRDRLFDPVPGSEPVAYVPYNATVQPYSDIAEERLGRVKAQRKVRRQFRKSRMRWIEQLVDEICRRKRC
uniref:Uncharacterized protein n=1 Tax=Anopheles dirus TaxID=7168 RepID=A0A182N2H8_9DIPT